MNEFKQHMLAALDKQVRIDGRKLLDYREIVIKKGFTNTAEGSAHVKIGATEVFAGVKMEIAKPFSDRPDEGAIMVNAELLPLSNPEFEAGPPGTDAIELARVVDRGIRESKAIDLKKLVIKKGEKCWMIVVDICPLNADGNLLDASALAAMAALQDAHFPKYENDEIDYKTPTDKKVELKHTPLSVTVLKIGNNYLVDPLHEEEKNLDARLTIAVTEDGTICALQKGGEWPLSLEDVNKMIDIAMERTRFLRGKL